MEFPYENVSAQSETIERKVNHVKSHHEDAQAGEAPEDSFYVREDPFVIEDQLTWIIPAIPQRDRKSEHSVVIATSAAQPAETGNYVSQVRKLVKNSGIYALASLASPLVSLVLAPFLTHHLSHADYGALTVLNTMIALAAGITQLGLNSAFFRSYNYDYETPRDRLDVLSTVVILLLLVSIVSALAMILAASWLATLLLENAGLADSLRLTGIIVLVQNLTVPGFAWLRAENRSILFVILSVANLLVNLVTTIIFVGIIQMGINGSLLAIGAGYAVITISTLPFIIWRAGMRLRLDILIGLLTFGLPNVSSFVSVWVLQLADRFLLARLGSLPTVASYGIAYSLGNLLNVVVLSPFLLAWPTVLFTIAKRDDAQHIFRLIFRWFGIILLFTTYALSLAAVYLFYLLFPPGYQSAAPIIPVVAVAIMFNGISNFMGLGIGIRRKTWLAFILTTIAAIINVALNLLLIPYYGSMGAALATLIAYALLAILCYIVNQYIYPVPFDIGRFIFALLIGVALYAGINYLIQPQRSIVALGFHLCVLAFYGICLALIGKVPLWSYTQRYLVFLKGL